MRVSFVSLLVVLGMTLGCGGPNYPDDLLALRSVGSDGGVVPLSCRPDVDGRISDDELPVALGATARYLVSSGEVVVDIDGQDQDGQRVWILDGVGPDDQVLGVSARGIEDAWFADRLPADSYAVPLDGSGRLLGLFARRPGALLSLGSVSAEENPGEGQTWLLYEPALDLFRLPLDVGSSWSQQASIRDGTVQGLPIAARHTLRVEVLREGRLVLPDLTFDRVLQVAMFVHQETVVGAPLDLVQVSFIAECYGEVARMSSLAGETTAAFTTASEVRRLVF
ncbi:MAG: hypothetical protein ABIJ09_07460 [Pseudomonadota bacterium]